MVTVIINHKLKCSWQLVSVFILTVLDVIAGYYTVRSLNNVNTSRTKTITPSVLKNQKACVNNTIPPSFKGFELNYKTFEITDLISDNNVIYAFVPSGCDSRYFQGNYNYPIIAENGNKLTRINIQIFPKIIVVCKSQNIPFILTEYMASHKNDFMRR